MALLEKTIRELGSFTRFDVDGFLGRWNAFSEVHYPRIVAFYEGERDRLDQEAIDAYEKMKEESQRLRDILRNVSGEMERLDGWELLELLDEINTRIRVIEALPRFLRVSHKRGMYNQQINKDYVVKDHETPERVAEKDKPDPQDDWVDIYIRNRVREVDYEAEEGGYTLELAKESLQSFTLNSVIDRLVGDNIYGKDFDKQFVFEDNDIKVLSPRDTFKQSVNILGTLNKGDIPEVPELGKSPDIAVGENLGAASVPFISREMQETFASDDTMVQFRIEDIRQEGTAIFIDYEVRSFFDLVQSDSDEV